jgi:HlyD family secretion protein
MVDRVIAKKKWSTKRLLTIGGILALVLLIFGSFYFTSGKSRLNVELERITVSTVTKGPFQETIPRNGVVMPITSIYLDATEGGLVEEKYVEDGAVMKKGDPILRLSNTDLLENMMTQQNQVYNTLTQMQINHNNAMQNTVTKQGQVADVDGLYNEAERIYNLDKHLYSEKVIGLQEFKTAQNNYNYLLSKKKLNEQILSQDSASRTQQEQQDQRSYKASQEALHIMQEKVGDLIVRAKVDGQLTSLDAEVGQNKNKGERIGQIDVLSGFKIRVDVDDHYIARIFTGLKGHFDFSDTTYQLVIKKVYTQVLNGVFNVDMTFVGKVPKGLRRGQTLQVFLELSEERTSILVPRGGFFQQTGGNWIFKVSDDGKKAYRVDITLGNQNPDYYEVVQGLKPGDKVITSSYETYGNMQELILGK